MVISLLPIYVPLSPAAWLYGFPAPGKPGAMRQFAYLYIIYMAITPAVTATIPAQRCTNLHSKLTILTPFPQSHMIYWMRMVCTAAVRIFAGRILIRT